MDDFDAVSTILRQEPRGSTPRRNCRPVPLVDLAAQHAAVAEEVADGWQQVLARTAFIGGPQVAAFESEYAAFIGPGHCVGVANGTDAIEIALRALGVGAGDECILPANTFIATAEAVCRAGATPVLVDCADDGTYLIDTAAVAAAVTGRTRAIIPVHLYGQAAPVEQLLPLADADRWLGGGGRGPVPGGPPERRPAPARSRTRPRPASTRARTWAPTATRGPCSPARPRWPRGCGCSANHGSARKYEHQVMGVNSRLDTLQAVVLSAKLRRLRRLERSPAGGGAALRHAAGRPG